MVPAAMMRGSDLHWVVVGSVGETPSFERRTVHWSGSYVLHRDPHVSFLRTFLKMVNTVKSDAPRIWSDRGVLQLAFLCDVVTVDFRTMLLLLASEVPETVVLALISAINRYCCEDCAAFRRVHFCNWFRFAIRISECLCVAFSSKICQAGKQRHPKLGVR